MRPYCGPCRAGKEPWRGFGLVVNERPMVAAADVQRVQALQNAYWAQYKIVHACPPLDSHLKTSALRAPQRCAEHVRLHLDARLACRESSGSVKVPTIHAERHGAAHDACW